MQSEWVCAEEKGSKAVSAAAAANLMYDGMVGGIGVGVVLEDRTGVEEKRKEINERNI